MYYTMKDKCEYRPIGRLYAKAIENRKGAVADEGYTDSDNTAGDAGNFHSTSDEIDRVNQEFDVN
uniref:Uncharacterized protein n=1 Tax=Onchocerca volvulus TaxID=6282 RepID=A0A8R1U1Q2_ONCVO